MENTKRKITQWRIIKTVRNIGSRLMTENIQITNPFNNFVELIKSGETKKARDLFNSLGEFNKRRFLKKAFKFIDRWYEDEKLRKDNSIIIKEIVKIVKKKNEELLKENPKGSKKANRLLKESAENENIGGILRALYSGASSNILSLPYLTFYGKHKVIKFILKDAKFIFNSMGEKKEKEFIDEVSKHFDRWYEDEKLRKDNSIIIKEIVKIVKKKNEELLKENPKGVLLGNIFLNESISLGKIGGILTSFYLGASANVKNIHGSWPEFSGRNALHKAAASLGEEDGLKIIKFAINEGRPLFEGYLYELTECSYYIKNNKNLLAVALKPHPRGVNIKIARYLKENGYFPLIGELPSSLTDDKNLQKELLEYEEDWKKVVAYYILGEKYKEKAKAKILIKNFKTKPLWKKNEEILRNLSPNNMKKILNRIIENPEKLYRYRTELRILFDVYYGEYFKERELYKNKEISDLIKKLVAKIKDINEEKSRKNPKTDPISLLSISAINGDIVNMLRAFYAGENEKMEGRIRPPILEHAKHYKNLNIIRFASEEGAELFR